MEKIMPETDEQKTRRLARWYHGGALGSIEFARMAMNRVIGLPHISEETKDLAFEVQSLLESIRTRLFMEQPK
jgi:hypothetical protein